MAYRVCKTQVELTAFTVFIGTVTLFTVFLFIFCTVYVIEFGNWDYREWAQKPEEKLNEFWKHFEQHIRRQSKDGGEDGVVEIVDWEGFSLSHHASRDGEYIKSCSVHTKLFCKLHCCILLLAPARSSSVNFCSHQISNENFRWTHAGRQDFEVRILCEW